MINKNVFRFFRPFILLFVLFFIFTSLQAQNFRRNPTPNDTLQSIKIHSDNKVTFQIYAPNADNVLLGGTDMPSVAMGTSLSKMDNGVWTVTVGPVDPGSYRYNFIVDDISLLDPKSTKISESNANVWSLFHISGSDFMDTKEIPHGAIAEITYYSKSLKRFRRMHVYTPPGYELGEGIYPVFYLLHGAFDCDDSWSTVGRAGIILDNLIADNQAKPMVMVMPTGHTGPFSFGRPRGDSSTPPVDEFLLDFENDIKPYIEANYRIYKDRQNTAIAGLSMGGSHTLNIAIPHLKDFAYIGVYSSGIFGITGNFGGDQSGPSWEEQHIEDLNSDAKEGLELFWFATGKDDFLVETSRATVEMFKKHGFDVIYKESAGGHTWINWRDYLNEFAPQLFQ